MKRPFAASVWREGKWFIAQGLEVEVAGQGHRGRSSFQPPRSPRSLFRAASSYPRPSILSQAHLDLDEWERL